MVNHKLIFRVIGSLLLLEAGFMLICVGLAIFFTSPDLIPFIASTCITVAAGICLNFNDYRWGTGGSFFKTSPLQGRCLGTFSKRGRIALLHSKQEMPPHFLVGGDGYILPGSYVQVEMVETIFRTPRRMNYFHQNSSKAKRRLTSGEPDLPSFRDQLVQSAIPDLCRALFRKASLQALTDDELAELLKQLRYRFSSNVNQLMRVTGLTYVQLTELLSKV